jgi:FAD/FMN-containing dehydrogenase
MTLELTRLDGSRSMLAPEALQAFKAGFKGAVLAPDDPAYDETRKVWNAMIDRRPGLIVRCTGTVDVQQAVGFARQHRLLLSVRSGGHNIAGLAVCEGGLMIDLSLMRGVFVDPRDAGPRPGGGAGLRVGHRHCRPDGGRWFRLPHAPARLDLRQRQCDGSGDGRWPAAAGGRG